MKIDISVIENLAENIDKYGLSEITLESDETKIILKREKVVVSNIVQSKVVQTTTNLEEEIQEEILSNNVNEDEDYEAIVSPMVGTFYKSPSPQSENFVEVGQNIEPGEVLCIIEAMKLMNEVKSSVKGTIVKILVEDGQAIKKGDKLFLIK
ncbi:MAG: acetyl-CoA carboxylase biotin carboxyl carrier protein [Cetobacterium sp.]|uniref:acetyl-CoA carboxylase biotin carboxyl carrier protein n=1 Tax=unclassified Cetobacterium TaxID=2630983 RepID=UPI00163BDFBF|nr:acetyl-CoA carboxylase biotin carboxyl carrier protein [Cetobacterium sp. 2A]MBC2856606.1 acetyl-CoA carboxylase biotin carboxyl carrier protein [Cetobacterium sp. 2A]